MNLLKEGTRMKITKKIVLIVMVLLVAWPVFASNVGELNGNNWLTFEKMERYCFISGLLAGQGIVDNKMRFDASIIKDISKKDDLAWRVYTLLEADLNKLQITEISVGQLVEGVDEFYKNFANKKITIVDAVHVVKMQIRGENPELIDAQTRYLRMQPIPEQVSRMAQKIMIEKGLSEMDRETLLKAGFFLDKNSNDGRQLFLYGVYK